MNPGEYNSMTDPVPQLNYATYYNHAGGYYHECPMMLVGPVIPDPTVSNVITTMPCAPVPMGPIEWFNPGYPAKVGSPQQCLLDYHVGEKLIINNGKDYNCLFYLILIKKNLYFVKL